MCADAAGAAVVLATPLRTDPSGYVVIDTESSPSLLSGTGSGGDRVPPELRPGALERGGGNEGEDVHENAPCLSRGLMGFLGIRGGPDQPMAGAVRATGVALAAARPSRRLCAWRSCITSMPGVNFQHDG